MPYLAKVAKEEKTDNYGCNYLNQFPRRYRLQVCQWDCRTIGYEQGICRNDDKYCTCFRGRG